MKKTLLISILAMLGLTQVMAESYYSLPIVREGVKWVNEKVIINHGDTTSYYYIYEFSGYDSICTNMPGEINHACYYYTDGELDVERDSLIAGFREPWPRSELTFVRNDAYFSLYDEDMINIELNQDENEKNPEHLKAAEDAYLELAELYNWEKIECVKDNNLRSIEDINEEILKIVSEIK